MSGRPLRFLAVVAVGWIAVRAIILLAPGKPETDNIQLRTERPDADLPLIVPTRTAVFEPPPPLSRSSTMARAREVRDMRLQKESRAIPGSIAEAVSTDIPSATGAGAYLEPLPQLVSPLPGTAPTTPAGASRWSASAWLLLRDGSGTSAGLGGGQLGGGQGGIRIAYAINRSSRLTLVGRLVSPVSGKGREAALGLDWRPTHLPIRLVAEQRFSLDGGKGGPVIGVVGGTGPARLALGFDLETYGQAGVIRREHTEAFADGSARLTLRVAKFGKGAVDLGVGAWGGAQRDAQRFDLGPTLGVRVPVAGKSVRLAIDWRQRVLGDAKPDSGPALTVGSDF